MVNIDTYDVAFTFDQPDAVRKPLLTVLQQALTQPKMHAARGLSLSGSSKIFIIDASSERSLSIARILASAGYDPLIAPTALESYTLFLGGACVPCAIIIGHDDANDRFFLQRLLQQMIQRYNWEIPLIRLRSITPTSPRIASLQPPPSTQTQRNNSFVPQSPRSLQLPKRNNGGTPMTPSYFPPPPDGFVAPTTSPLSPPILSRTSSPATPVPDMNVPPMVTNPLPPTPATPPSPPQARKIEKISLEGQNIGRYQLQSRIGGNTLTDVYLTYDRLREQNVALKVIQTNAIPYYLIEGSLEESNLFEQEIALLAEIKHPHILPIMKSGKAYVSGYPFLYKTMTYCAEGSLIRWIDEHRSERIFAPQEVIPVIVQLADALQEVHDRHITYQNFKMSNLLVRDRAKNLGQVHLMFTDFAVTQDGTAFTRTADEFPYMAPEQWEGLSLAASDQYGLAAIAYELLTGRPPFQAHAEQVIRRMHLHMQPQDATTFNATVSPFLNTVLLRALAKRPQDRFDSIMAFARMLQRYGS